jgi:hypothetical protein
MYKMHLAGRRISYPQLPVEYYMTAISIYMSMKRNFPLSTSVGGGVAGTCVPCL